MFTHLRQNLTWQDRRIQAMNRIIKNNKFASEHLIEEYVGVLQSKHKTKQEYKREMYNANS